VACPEAGPGETAIRPQAATAMGTRKNKVFFIMPSFIRVSARLTTNIPDPPEYIKEGAPIYIPNLATISCFVLPRISSFLPTLMKASRALSRWWISWPAEIWVRIRAWPWGTTGKKNPMA
jgi:hypothetical protein